MHARRYTHVHSKKQCELERTLNKSICGTYIGKTHGQHRLVFFIEKFEFTGIASLGNTSRPNMLCLNANELTRQLLEKYPDEIHWKHLSMNNTSWAIAFLEQYPDKIHWEILSGNPHPRAIALLEKHPEKISWLHLSGNIHPRAAHLLAQHPDRIA